MPSSTSSTDTDDAGLPALDAVRTQATVRGRDGVVICFGTGARLRYVAAGETVREEWLGPDDDAPARTSERSDASLAEAALNAAGEYLSFDDRRRAAFVWGSENLAVVTDE